MNAFNFISPKRIEKPRNIGVTMVLDKGLGFNTAKDLMALSGEYVDYVKFGWGTISIHDRKIIQEKIDMYHDYEIHAYPGGTLFELAYMKDKISEYYAEAHSLGFDTIEISNGSLDINDEEKQRFISEACDEGFHVISEVGKKDPKLDASISLEDRVRVVKEELAAGSDYVIIEAREGGKNVGIFDSKGKVMASDAEYLIDNLPQENVIWEAPQKDQQIYFILNVGQNVNLGNISSDEITSLETLRRGLRGDTIGKF